MAAAAAYATPRWESGEVRAPGCARGAGAPLLRIRCAAGADGGGAALDVDVLHDDGLGELASRLAARGTAPLAALRLGAADLQAGVSAGGAGFGRPARALHAADGGACAGLRELALRNIELPAAAARLLAASLAGHPTLASLELWNVELDDDGALAVGALGAPVGDGGGNAALRSSTSGATCCCRRRSRRSSRRSTPRGCGCGRTEVEY